jgi:hypothetical protein
VKCINYELELWIRILNLKIEVVLGLSSFNGKTGPIKRKFFVRTKP